EGQEVWAPYKVFQTGSASSFYGSPLYRILMDGNEQRDLPIEIERYQLRRFGNPMNIGKITGSRARPKEINQETMDAILKNMAANRISLINVRAEITTQHVILVKKVTPIPGGYSLTVYDSNYPNSDNELRYLSADREFVAPRIIRAFGVSQPEAPVGVFLEDED